MRLRSVIASIVVLAPAAARADGSMPGMDMADDNVVKTVTTTHFTAGVSLLAAQFATMEYEGNYQGALPSLAWMSGRVGAMASAGLYRLVENGREVHGIGDVMASGWVTLWTTPVAALGVEAHAMAPTGAMADGLGMGHPMGSLVLQAAVPIAQSFAVHAEAGYSRALVFGGEMHHHGAMPLVEPMGSSEIVWGASGDYAMAHAIAVGAHVWGGVPVGEAGVTRVAGGLRVRWGHGKVSTGAELQAGLVGDPFTVRGILQTGVSF